MIDFLAQHAGMLAAGATTSLLAGALIVFFTPSPIRQLRCAELTIGLSIAWLALACVPLARPWQRYVPRVLNAVTPTRKPVKATSLPVAARMKSDRTVVAATPRRTAAVVPPRKSAAESSIQPIAPTAKLDGTAASSTPLERATAAQVDYTDKTTRTKTLPAKVRPTKTSSREPKATAAAVRPAPLTPAVHSANDNIAGSLAPSTDWFNVAAFGFAVGCGVCAAWLLLGQSILFWIVRKAATPASWLEQLYRRLPHRGGRPRLLVSRHCPRPVAFGLWRPTIVLPASCCAADRRSQLTHVLLHELGHVGQRDAWSQALFNVALPLLFWNPLYWLLYARARLCRELLADDWAAGQSDKESYARELVALLVGGGRFTQAGLSVSGVFRTSTEFYRRMAMLLEREERLERRCGSAWRLGAAACAGLALMLLTGAWGLSAGPEQGGSQSKFANFVYPGDRDDEEDDAEERSDAEESDDEEGDDGDDEGDGDDEMERDDEDGEAMKDEFNEVGDDERDDEDDGADDSALDELAQRRQQLQAELDELASHIDQKEQARQQRAAERERREAERNSRQSWEELQGQWKSMLEELDARTTERIERLENRLNETSEQVERLTGERDGLQQLLNAMQERLEESAAAREQLLAEFESLREQRAEREQDDEMEEQESDEDGDDEKAEGDDEDAKAELDDGDEEADDND